MPDVEAFRLALGRLFSDRTAAGAEAITVRSGDLHRAVGGYPGNSHSMPTCCNVMRQFMMLGDEVVESPPKCNGASLVIRYRLPRSHSLSQMLSTIGTESICA